MTNDFASYRILTDANLEIYFNHYLKDVPEEIAEAIRYSVLSRGKRVRPTLVFLSAKAFGMDEKAAMPLAIAIELIHNYSLVHDDLPCMDNDDMRSGLPTTHKKFGEAMGVLAGDALLTLAFEVLADAVKVKPQFARAAACFAKNAGAAGMIGGQVLDIRPTLKDSELLKMYALKTGALIKAAILAPALAAGATDAEINALDAYASYVGLSFQIADDILDAAEGEVEKNFCAINGKEAAVGTLKTFLQMANRSLDNLNHRDTADLKAYATVLSARKV